MNLINEMFKFFIEMFKGVLWYFGEIDCIFDMFGVRSVENC